VGAPPLLHVGQLAAQDTAPEPEHYVFFGLERDRIREPSFLEIDAVRGAQLKYTWRELEPERGRYDLEPIRSDLAFLEEHGKALFMQIQDVSFDVGVVNVPDYLLTDPAFGGGVARTYVFEGDDDATATPEGWVARRWDPEVRERLIGLLTVLGAELDGRIAGLNLPETSLDFGTTGSLHPDGFDYETYAQAVRDVMAGARRAFSESHVLQYANFMPGEWLPWEDRGYLRGIYAYAEQIGVGVGGPDVLPHRRGQRSHSYPLIADRAVGTVAGLAVQDGNLADVNPETGAPVTVEELAGFARDVLRLDFVFWGTEEPYYSRDVLPYLRAR
jgi:hypothetical protein